MKYLLVFFILVMVLSPLAWLRSSPAQKRVTAFRGRAMARRLQVQLVPAIDAAEGDQRPTAVRYLLAYPGQRAGELGARMGAWCLLRNHHRGWPSPWPDWHWYRGEAPPQSLADIGAAVAALPEAAYAMRAEPRGVSVYLREVGELEVVDRIAGSLETLVDGDARDH